MPQAYWMYQKKRWTKEEMEAYAATHPLDFPYDPEMLDAMWQHSEREFLSPTMLNSCARQVALKRLVPYGEYLRNAWTRFRGNLGHLLMEHTKLKLPGVVREERMVVKVALDGHIYEIYGKPDKYVVHDQLLVDYKTVEELVDINTEKGRKKLNGWATQLSLYRWMLHHNGVPIERAIISEIHMHEPARIEVPLWPLENVEVYIRERLLAGFKDVFTCDLDSLPPTLKPDDDMFWLCNSPWCPVSYPCKQLAQAEALAQAASEEFVP
jgi:hypothetical protein